MSVFTDKAPKIMVTLLRDFPEWGPEDAAADLGSAGHESAGFEDQIESDGKDGGLGGIGWYQWTGHTTDNPRRKEYEAYCNRNGLDKFSDKANYGFHFVELKGFQSNIDESRTIGNTKAASGLYNKTVAFEKSYERAGVKHYDRRYDYAKQALSAYNASDKVTGILDNPAPPPTSKPLIIGAGMGAIAGIIAVLQYFGLI